MRLLALALVNAVASMAHAGTMTDGPAVFCEDIDRSEAEDACVLGASPDDRMIVSVGTQAFADADPPCQRLSGANVIAVRADHPLVEELLMLDKAGLFRALAGSSWALQATGELRSEFRGEPGTCARDFSVAGIPRGRYIVLANVPHGASDTDVAWNTIAAPRSLVIGDRSPAERAMIASYHAQHLIRAGDDLGALDLMRSAVQLKPDDPSLLAYTAELLGKVGLSAESKQMAQRALGELSRNGTGDSAADHLLRAHLMRLLHDLDSQER